MDYSRKTMTFPLRILTAQGPVYQGSGERLILRTVSGDMAILPGHITCAALLGTGRLMLLCDQWRIGRCSGGVVTVLQGVVTVLPEQFSWENESR